MPTNTATSFTSHTGNGTAGPFSISFSFFAETDIKVLVGGEFKTLNTHYTFTSGSQITFTSGNEPGNGVSIKFTRNTDISSKKIDFEDGSVLTEADLDTQNDQILFALQEFTDIVNNDLLLRDGSNTVIGSLQFEGANDDNFETKITVENPTTDRTITLPNITGTVVTRSDTGTVTSTMISPGTIVNGDINPAANINGSKLSNDSVSLAKLGGGALPTDITIASANIVNGSIIEEDIATGTLDGRYYTETELDAGQLDNRYFTETELNSGQLDNRYFTESELNSGQLDNRYFTETELSSGALDARYFTETELTNGTLDSRYFTETELNNGQLDNRYFTETELNPSATTGANVLDARYYTEAEADARFYNLASSEEIQSGETWTAADNKVATTAAIDARIIDLVDDVGGFVPITNELSFPNTNPDINNGAGTLISIQALSTAYTSNGSGTFTIANGTIGNSTVTVTGATASTTFTAGFGMILETTSTLNTYTFHRLVPKATEVTTVAGNVSNVNTVAGIDSNVTTVAGIAANVTTVAGISSNVTSVAGSITNVNTVATNLSGVNAFADRYSSGSSNPTSNLDVGDLFFNTTDNELKVYNGSAWQSGVTVTSNVALTTGNTFTGNNVFNDNVKALFGTGSDLEIFHNGSDSIINDAGTGNLKLQVGGSTKFTLDSSGNVGIGTSSPPAILSTEQSTGNINLDLHATGSGRGSQVKFHNDHGTSFVGIAGSTDGALLVYQQSNAPTLFHTNNLERMRIDSSGKIGIGTTNPEVMLDIRANDPGIQLLDTSQTSAYGNMDFVGDTLVLTSRGGTSSHGFTDFRTFDGSTIRTNMRIDSSGRVGIGTTSPDAALVVQGSSGLPHAVFRVASNSGSTKAVIQTVQDSDVRIGASTNHPLTFFQNSLERMRIDSSGRVGIGTTSPDAPLTIHNDSDPEIRFGYNSSQDHRINWDSSKVFLEADPENGNGNSAIGFKVDGIERMRINSSGHVLIGTTSLGNTHAYFQIESSSRAILHLGCSATSALDVARFKNSNGTVGNIRTSGTNTQFNTQNSDRTMKKNFESWNENVLNLFKDINPQKFNFIQEDDGSTKSKGFIAQDMVSSFPEAYTKAEEEDAKYFFNPSGMVVYLMKAIQELEAKVAALEAA